MEAIITTLAIQIVVDCNAIENVIACGPSLAQLPSRLDRRLVPHCPVRKLNLLNTVSNYQLIVRLRQPQGHRPKVLPKVLSHEKGRRCHSTCHKYGVDVGHRSTPVLHRIRPAPDAEDVRITATITNELIVPTASIQDIIAHPPKQLIVPTAPYQGIHATVAIENIVPCLAS